MSKPCNPSRREILQGLSAAVTAAVLPGSAEAVSAQHWDKKVDVVVVGSGTGLVGALVAADAGLKVLVLEKHPGTGGTTLVSGGVVWIPLNPVQAREGIQDNRADALTYLHHLAQGQADEELILAFLNRGGEMLDYVERHTKLRWRVSQLMGPIGDYHPEWAGSNVRGRSVEPVRPGTERAGGLLIEGLLEALQARGVEILTGTPARQLVARDTPQGKEVIGVEAGHESQPLRIRARRGVLMASGGFERNEEMKRHFLRGPSPYTLGCETNTGDGIHMGMALGGDLRNMNEVWGTSVYTADAKANGKYRGSIPLMHPGGAPGGILVNRHGDRFCNEAGDYDSRWRTFQTLENWGDLSYRNIPAFHICDQSLRESSVLFGASKNEPLPKWAVTASTLAELGAKLGIDPKSLEATVADFNNHAAQGLDPYFHRGEGYYDRRGRSDPSVTLKPLAMQGPFYGAEVSPADMGTCGGLRVDGRARVIDVFNRPIARLYASGNTTGVGSPGASYGGGGGTLGPALTFAYIAGQELAQYIA